MAKAKKPAVRGGKKGPKKATRGSKKAVAKKTAPKKKAAGKKPARPAAARGGSTGYSTSYVGAFPTGTASARRSGVSKTPTGAGGGRAK